MGVRKWLADLLFNTAELLNKETSPPTVGKASWQQSGYNYTCGSLSNCCEKRREKMTTRAGKYTIGPEIQEHLTKLQNDLDGIPRTEILKRAIAFFSVALDAEKHGSKVLIESQDKKKRKIIAVSE